ncbi:hypothetical protein HMPREF0765_3567 [Sphingobacterium spiritivorum ATCC 33300]|uniref:Uncharacterized protein n=1 Tax=Sphingobacterium spiritivorum ATCC 33300 TaxID=525372 RepID=C2G1W1_SPHSI|nr:hypothetical protein HMPREF0765_3567 [Sphingobacterium spiritivorum ATCC 33300]
MDLQSWIHRLYFFIKRELCFIGARPGGVRTGRHPKYVAVGKGINYRFYP